MPDQERIKAVTKAPEKPVVKPTIKKAAEAKPNPAAKNAPSIEVAKAKAEPVTTGKQASWTEIMNAARGLRPDGKKR